MLVHLRLDYFHEFHHSIPLSNNYWAHLWESDAYDSFSEIFIQQEYSQYIPNDPISRILDIGAHYGYFTLWLQSKYHKQDIHSLMVEPSPKCKRSLEKLVNQNQFKGKFSFLQRAINTPNIETTKFYDRSHMAGSIFADTKKESYVEIQTLKEEDVFKAVVPPYDLIKCDIEGTEWEFINHYPRLLQRSKYLLLEWHSWHRGGGGVNQLLKKFQDIRFEILQISDPLTAVSNEGEVGLILAKNLDFQN
jgi:FkbM family methyltransferase